MLSGWQRPIWMNKYTGNRRTTSQAERVGENDLWQMMCDNLCLVTYYIQAPENRLIVFFWKHLCILLPFEHNMHFSQVFKLIYTLGSCFWQCHSQMQWSHLLAILPEPLYIETSFRFGCKQIFFLISLDKIYYTHHSLIEKSRSWTTIFHNSFLNSVKELLGLLPVPS